MSIDNKIFSKGVITENKNKIQKIKYNRAQLLSKDTAYELNTYLNFGIFPTFSDTYTPEYEEVSTSNGTKYVLKTDVDTVGTPGVRSIFNRAGAVLLGFSDGKYDVDITDGSTVHSWRIGNNVPLMDSPRARQRIRMSSGCSIKELVHASEMGAMGQETYAYSDFMYCKHLGKMPNNYMITLRRFPLPVDDYIGAEGEYLEQKLNYSANQASSIGCMVTWMGVSGNDLSSLLKYSYKMPFKEETSEEQDLKDNDGNGGILNSVFAVFDENYRKAYQDGYTGEQTSKLFSKFGIPGDFSRSPYKDYAKERDTKTKVYGPIDSIRTTYMRSDTGLVFDQKLTLVFEYELKSYNGINGKQAMLDLISNILNVTYTTGSFWGGGFKGFAAPQSNIFANLNIFKARGGFTNFVDAFSKDLSTIGSSIKNTVDENGGLWETIKSMANNLGGMLMSGALNALGRPHKTMYNALLSPAPIGFWHVTIGNPKKPIMSIGNMIVTNCTIEHTGPLGIDDFPTGLKVTVELDRGKPRDLRDIEKLYMQGTDRIYSSMSDKVFDMYKNAELYKSSRSNPSSYKPVANVAEIKFEDGKTSKPTITIADYDKLKGTLKKYFGTEDTYSIYIPAAEQEYGSGRKKPSTDANKSLVGG